MKLGVNKSVNLEMKLSGSRANRWKTIKDNTLNSHPLNPMNRGGSTSTVKQVKSPLSQPSESNHEFLKVGLASVNLIPTCESNIRF